MKFCMGIMKKYQKIRFPLDYAAVIFFLTSDKLRQKQT